MAKKQALPEYVFISKQNAGTDDEYLSADVDREAHVGDDTEIVTVGHYRLVETVKLRKAIEVVK